MLQGLIPLGTGIRMFFSVLENELIGRETRAWEGRGGSVEPTPGPQTDTPSSQTTDHALLTLHRPLPSHTQTRPPHATQTTDFGSRTRPPGPTCKAIQLTHPFTFFPLRGKPGVCASLRRLWGCGLRTSRSQRLGCVYRRGHGA